MSKYMVAGIDLLEQETDSRYRDAGDEADRRFYMLNEKEKLFATMLDSQNMSEAINI